MRRVAVAAALAAAVLVAAAPAGAVIRIQKGMAGVTLGMAKSRVLAKLGKPSRTRVGRNDFGRYTQLVYFGAGVEVTFQSGSRVTSIATALGSERTAAGIGVASTKKQVLARVPGVHCRKEPEGPEHCFVGNFRPGTRVTDFVLRRGGIVTRVTVGFVLD